MPSCAGRTEPPRIQAIVPDLGPLADCPRRFPLPAALPPLAPFALADGRRVVLLETVQTRDALTASFIVEARGAWHRCASPVLYVEDWAARIEADKANPALRR